MKKTICFMVALISITTCYSQTAVDYHSDGMNKFLSNDTKGAIVYFSKAIALDSNLSSAYFSRATAKQKLEDYRGAIADLSKVIELEPSSIAYSSRGFIKSKLQDYKGAVTDFDQSIALAPDYSGAYLGRGLAKLQLWQKDSGCLDLSKAGELGSSRAYDEIKKYCQ